MYAAWVASYYTTYHTSLSRSAFSMSKVTVTMDISDNKLAHVMINLIFHMYNVQEMHSLAR